MRTRTELYDLSDSEQEEGVPESWLLQAITSMEEAGWSVRQIVPITRVLVNTVGNLGTSRSHVDVFVVFEKDE